MKFILKKVTYFFWGGVCCFILGCNADSKNIFSDNEKIKVVFNNKETLSSTIFCDSIAGLQDLFAYEDYIVVFHRNNHHLKLFTVLNSEGITLSEFGSKGNASDEFINNFFRGQYFLNDKSELVIWISDDSKMSLKALNVTQSIVAGKAIIEQVIPTMSYVLEAFIKDDSTMYITRQINDNVELIEYNYLSRKKIVTQKLYQLSMPPSDIMCYSSDWAITPDGKKIIGVMASFNQLNLMASNGKEKKVITTSNSFMSTNQALGEDKLPINQYYEKVVATNELIYALYAGYPYNDVGNSENSSKIEIFDLNGNAIRELYLDRYIYTFSIDPTHKVIYGLDLEDRMWKFDYDF